MLWDWGFLWKDLEFMKCKIGINATARGRDDSTGKPQSTGVSSILSLLFHNSLIC
jgi:hypothetical protein